MDMFQLLAKYLNPLPCTKTQDEYIFSKRVLLTAEEWRLRMGEPSLRIPPGRYSQETLDMRVSCWNYILMFRNEIQPLPRDVTFGAEAVIKPPLVMPMNPRVVTNKALHDMFSITLPASIAHSNVRNYVVTQIDPQIEHLPPAARSSALFELDEIILTERDAIPEFIAQVELVKDSRRIHAAQVEHKRKCQARIDEQTETIYKLRSVIQRWYTEEIEFRQANRDSAYCLASSCGY